MGDGFRPFRRFAAAAVLCAGLLAAFWALPAPAETARPAPAPDAGAAAETALGLSFEDRKSVQAGLAALGHDPGPADGIFGRKTRAALLAFQSDRGLAETGFLTREVADALAEGGRAAARERAEREARDRAERERKDREARERNILATLGMEHLGRPFSPRAREGGVGWTDLHYAALLDLPEVVHALIGAGLPADVRLAGDLKEKGDALKRKLESLGHGHFAEWKSANETPLTIAALADARAAAAALLDRGADIEAKTYHDWTPLRWAARSNARETAQLLLDRGADIEAKDIRGNTPLHTAAYKNARATAELLLDRGADIEAKNDFGNTPLHLAGALNARETAELLLARGAER